jgi:hypothetical protein
MILTSIAAAEFRCFREPIEKEAGMFSRRRVLWLAVLGGGVGVATTGAAAARPVTERLLAVFTHRASARRLGAKVPPTLGGPSEAALVDALISRQPGLAAALEQGDDAAVARSLREAVAEDFRHVRTHVAGGLGAVAHRGRVLRPRRRELKLSIARSAVVTATGRVAVMMRSSCS